MSFLFAQIATATTTKSKRLLGNNYEKKRQRFDSVTLHPAADELPVGACCAVCLWLDDTRGAAPANNARLAYFDGGKGAAAAAEGAQRRRMVSIMATLSA